MRIAELIADLVKRNCFFLPFSLSVFLSLPPLLTKDLDFFPFCVMAAAATVAVQEVSRTE
jgi:branched-subunit amino acid transport protein